MLTLVVMAAGLGSRFGGIKQMEPIGPSGECLLEYSVFDAVNAGFEKVVFVIRKDIEADFRSHILTRFEGKVNYAVCFQELDALPGGFDLPEARRKPWGTGHAVLCAKEAISGAFAVINADDFYGASAFKQLAEQLRREGGGVGASPTFAMVGYLLKNTLSEFGSVSRGVCELDAEGHLITVHEHTSIEQVGADSKIISISPAGVEEPLSGEAIVSLNLWGFPQSFCELLEAQFHYFLEASIAVDGAEFYLPSAVNAAIVEQNARVAVLECNERWYGVTYTKDKAVVVDAIRDLVSQGHYPEQLWR